MELKISTPKPGCLSPSDFVSEPEEKEVSDDDDDDRNHKHRRRDIRSQSSERDAIESVMSKPFKKHSKAFGNRHIFRENESQGSENLSTYNNASAGREFSSKFDRRRLGVTMLPRAPLDLSQRTWANQTFAGDHGPGKGRGRDSGSWNQRDSRFNSNDVASQMVQQGSIPPIMYTGRGLPNVSNAQSASWNGFGILPGIPNGGLDMIHSIGLQGTLRPPINSSLNMGIPRQRCRDFEERGFCLRGDICPMEHGVNRIVIEDVQSLSQFNLPVSLPSAHLLGTAAGSGPLQSLSASAPSMNIKSIHGKANKPRLGDEVLGLNGAYPGSSCAGGADLYDPDQPLWNNSGPETSNALLTVQSPKADETESFPNDASSDRQHVRLYDSVDNDCPVGTSATAIGLHSASLSVWGRIGSSNNRFDVKEKVNSTPITFPYLESGLEEEKDELTGFHGDSRPRKQTIADDAGQKSMDSSSRPQGDSMRNSRKPSQKAVRTLFVNGIPLKSNKRDSLLSHFQKFGEVMDIYIPLNSERAFVQFSKREEAEAALKSPDAVMGNRFIKLWWANRDNIPDDAFSSGTGVSEIFHGVAPASVPFHPAVSSRGKDTLHQSAILKIISDELPASDHPKPVILNGPKVPPPIQKKLENLEQLKEEIRKKQEMLEQKRTNFRRQLDKLEKQATGVKGEIVTEQAAKRPKVCTSADIAKSASPRSSDSVCTAVSPHAKAMVDKKKSAETTVTHSPKTITTMVVQESTGLKQPIHSLTPVASPILINRYKLDNRPTVFRIIPPLPAGLANVAVLKEHFLLHGDLSDVELEGLPVHDGSSESEASPHYSARITFTTRHAAERAFANGKCWKGHNLKFMWLTSSTSSNGHGHREKSQSAPEETLDTDVSLEEKLECNVSQEAPASGDGEPIASATASGFVQAEPSEASQCTPCPASCEKESPEGNLC
ncbi:Zinc finger CCCH domain-containing protein 41 [Quillaja saponaria]|uniref:Zinc finger CCCH domain-containing protein 41 n=1 Tax=Quillaja saponaria TaxID=32244 RepID=A0AAD7PWH3_QUISA|nr:Zinc finger CCCH domain-containing protein 41 [Quillaja saponaria]KAJ7970797.1 Zinc finger CCCH domain-containing protein 41 [Quillaja saponaria]